MKSIFTITTLMCFLCFTNIKTEAQLASGIPFTFAASTPSTPPVTTVIINLANRPAAIRDDFDTLIPPAGWTFDFAGVTYSKFIFSTNGWIALVPSSMGFNVPPYFSSALPHNSLSTYSGGLPLIAPLWDDDSCTAMQYGILSNILTVSWTLKWDKSYTGIYERIFWMTLDGNTGVITFNYSNTPYLAGNTASASIGIAGVCPGSFLSVTPNVWVPSSTVDSVIEDSVIVVKPIDAKFVFTPQVINSLIWQGATDSLFGTNTNWGYCGVIPGCGINARIPQTGSGHIPYVYGNQSVGDFIVDAGATLHLTTGSTLNICGDFSNYGRLIADPGSVINFSGSGTQLVSGNLTDTNSFASLSITKPSGIVFLNTDIDLKNDFYVSNSTSVFNINGKYMKVGGSFTNYDGVTTKGIGESTVEFNGADAQYYTNTHGNDTLNRVIINKPIGKLYLAGGYNNLNIDSVLTLISGNIVTSSAFEVNVLYGNISAIRSYSKDSYIDGRLRRKLYLGSIDFPLGDSLVPNQGADKGYELANISFTSSTVINNLLAWFNIWGIFPPVGPAGPDYCGPDTLTYNTLPLYDNGYWAFQRDASAFNGNYDVTLYNTGGTNPVGPAWTFAKAPIGVNPYMSSSWNLLGTCIPSTLATTKRVALNSPAADSTSFNHLYATAQGNIQLPNSIDDLYGLSDVIIAPNPNNGKFNVMFDNSHPVNYHIEITNALGEKLKSMAVGNRKMIEVELNEPAGIYFLNVYGEGKRIFKVVKTEY